jgi:serine/threonine protein kinase/basic membrane lipoprotein Med (substrate-binding protein (PBP1-ABC) superfamily)/ABC-type phosphate/phosphonate transport system substrate-binding protein
MNDLVGRTLGQYRIIEQLGKGGMATVYRAFQPSLERHVAIKVLMPYFAHEEGFSQRFVREAKAIARLDHPHILPIYDYGHEGETHYIVMKCVEAGTLQDLEAGQPVPLDVSAKIISQIADALDYAHQAGVVHRDVKPANVLMDRGEWVLLTDFGLARMVEGSQQLTASGVGVGTPAYMPPEQCQGRTVDRRADIYSLGIVLYEMLTGCVPFEAETPLAVVLKHITEPLPMPRSIDPEIPEAVELVILKALAKEPEDRYQTAGEMAAALCNAVECANRSPFVVPPSTGTPSPAAIPESVGRDDGAARPAAHSEPYVQGFEPALPLRAAAEKASDVVSVPVPAEAAASVTESIDRARPVPSGRRVPWWAYVAAAIVVLTLIASGAWLGLGGWSGLAARFATPTVPGEQAPSPTPTVPDQQAPTATPAIVESTPPLAKPDTRLRIAISVRPEVRVEVDVRHLTQLLTAGTGMELEVIAVDHREGLLDLLRGGQLDVILLSMPEYLWLRDGEGVPLDPALYAEPLFAGVVVVRADGPVHTVDDLRGQAVVLPGWDAPAGLLGRAALLERGLDVVQECEVIYVAPGDEPGVWAEAFALLGNGQVAAAIVPNLALGRFEEQSPALADRLRILAESPPTSVGVVAVRPSMPPDRVAALLAALLELDPESFRAGTPFGRLIAVDEPLADHMADALRKLDISARQWVEAVPSEPQVSPDRPARPPVAGEIRIALVPAAGTSVETRYVTPIYESIQKASRDLRLELIVRETPEGESPGDVTVGLIEQGYNVIVAVGWHDPDLLWGIAREHADVRFVCFWHLFERPLPNLLSFAYRMDQAGFLAGTLAGRATETKRVAVIGGIPIPSVGQLVSGFDQGVKRACPECEVIVRFTDTFSNLPLGEEVGRQVVEEGADVVFNAAGVSGSAAIRSAAQQGAWVIGMDLDEYLLTFGGGSVPNVDRLLGSVVIRANRQAYETLERLVRGDFEPGSFALGVAEEGFEFLPSPESAHPRWSELEQQMREITEGLRSGEISP